MLEGLDPTPDSVLARFTRDLTAAARAGALEPVRCRADEVARVIDILLRHGKNNPVLVGAAGVGKTAIVEGLAQRVAEGTVPVTLRGVRVLALDHVALLAGTSYRGQYEARISRLVEETTASPDVILFVDELHNLMGQGTAVGVAMDAANMLKPALVRGDFGVIGATTDEEYARWIEGDPALERRFQKVVVRELGASDALEILRARQHRLERHHNVLIAEDALRAAVVLTDRHVRDRRLPDKAIDALDEACAHLQAAARYSPRAEALVARRAALLRRGERGAGSGERERYDARTADAPSAGARAPEAETFSKFARDGLTALERLSAEVEAAFGLAPAAPSADTSVEEQGPLSAPRSPLPAALEQELSRLLMEEGIVVRGHDVARVVGLMAGTTITWTE